jgi:predicted MPP superfamily phosphohydrolase
VKRRRRPGWAVIGVAMAFGAQIPALLAIGRLTREPAMALGLAAVMLAASLALARNPWEHRPRSRVELYLVMWPFFAWWTICAVFAGLCPVALLVAATRVVSLDQALTVAGGLAVVGGLRALSRRPRLCQHTISIVGLPEAFAGYRIAQISDLHCGPFTPPERVRRWVAAVNRLKVDLVAVTGDLITSGSDYTAGVSRSLGELRAPDGVLGCMGNHDYFTDGELFSRQLERDGLRLLRNEGLTLERAGSRLYLAGVDDTWTHRHDLDRALRDRPPGTPVVLLAHDPALFPAAAARGIDLTLSGHTHGGQIAAPVAPRRLNLARLVTPFTSGLYRIDHSVLYVNRGLGTTGPPIRLVARPEIAVFTLVPAAVDPAADRAHLAEDVIRDASEEQDD